MKKITTILSIGLLTFGLSLSTVFAQAPEKMSYQAVVRDAGNALVTNQGVGMQLSILQGSTSGSSVYTETQTPTTNINGLVSLEIGSGTVVTGSFNTIDWSAGPYFIKTETDPTGGTTYTITGTSQLMSVPYALHAKTAESITGTVNYTETDPVFGASIANGITALDTANWNNHIIDTDTQLDSTGIANLGYNAGSITTEVDGSVTNEIQDLQLSGNNLTITNNGTATTIDLSPYLDNTDTQLDETAVDAFVANNGYLATEVDGSITNELQTISRTGTTVTLSNGGGTFTDSVNTYTAGTNIAISASNVISATEVDGSITNEIQTISRTGTTVSLSNGGGTFTDSVNTYTPGTGIDITNNVISASDICGLSIGDTYQGGIIFYLDASGCHGLISAATDQSTGIQWHNGSYTTTNAVRDGIGAGKFNTERIIANQGQGAYAAQICANYQGGNYGDWYLPSKYELNLLYLQKAVVGGFAINYYFSSTEIANFNAWLQSYGDGWQYNYSKNYTVCVRAVRAF